jgi:hypothetical protein
MIAGEAIDEAVALALATPGLAVGLHLVVVGGPAVLPSQEIPHLVDDRGCFPNDPFQAGMRYLLSKAARRELGQPEAGSNLDVSRDVDQRVWGEWKRVMGIPAS